MAESSLPVPSEIKEINGLHDEIISDAKHTLAKAIKLGGLLIRAKATMPHGQWTSWVENNCYFTAHTAAGYVRLHQNRVELTAQKIDSARTAYKLITDAKTPSKTTGKARAEKTDAASVLNENALGAQGVAETDSGKKSPSAKPKPTEPEEPDAPDEPEPVLDKTGMVIPDGILEYWNRAGEVQAHLTAISKIRGVLRKAQEDKDPIWAEVTFSSALADLGNAYSEIQRGIPHAVCVKCAGLRPKGCNMCGGDGLLSKHFYETCIDSDTRKVRERAIATKAKK